MKAVPNVITMRYKGVGEGYKFRVFQYHIMGWLPRLRYTFQEMRKLENKGFCVFCGSTQGETKPDAEGYTCKKCKMPGVFGFEQLMLKGMAL